jgi:hypothetical protein
VKLTDLIERQHETGPDIEVGAQTRGCCSGAHEIVRVEVCGPQDRPNPGQIVLRCE